MHKIARRAGGLRVPALLIVGILGLVPGRVSASPIRHAHHEAARIDAADHQSWSRFVLGGPSVWSHVAHPQVTPRIEAVIWRAIRTDPGGTAPVLDYLLWKQRRDPARFAFYHSRLAPALTRLVAPTVSPQQLTPPVTPSTVPNIQPQQIPEPSTLLIAAMMLGFAARRVVRATSSSRSDLC